VRPGDRTEKQLQRLSSVVGVVREISAVLLPEGVVELAGRFALLLNLLRGQSRSADDRTVSLRLRVHFGATEAVRGKERDQRVRAPGRHLVPQQLRAMVVEQTRGHDAVRAEPRPGV